MTTITFFKHNGNFISFDVQGHTGFDVEGKDILCAAISAITQSLVLGITKVLKINCDVIKSNKLGSLKLSFINPTANQILDAQVLFNTAFISLKDLEKGYPLNIKVEVKN